MTFKIPLILKVPVRVGPGNCLLVSKSALHRAQRSALPKLGYLELVKPEQMTVSELLLIVPTSSPYFGNALLYAGFVFKEKCDAAQLSGKH